MQSIKEKHLEAMQSVNNGGKPVKLIEYAESCTAITEAAQDGFADWIADNHWHRRNKESWYQHICPDYLSTAELRRLYNRTKNK